MELEGPLAGVVRNALDRDPKLEREERLRKIRESMFNIILSLQPNELRVFQVSKDQKILDPPDDETTFDVCFDFRALDGGVTWRAGMIEGDQCRLVAHTTYGEHDPYQNNAPEVFFSGRQIVDLRSDEKTKLLNISRWAILDALNSKAEEDLREREVELAEVQQTLQRQLRIQQENEQRMREPYQDMTRHRRSLWQRLIDTFSR